MLTVELYLSTGLYEVLRQSFIRSSIPEPEDLIQVARNYSCDGCYEPMFTGSSEFKFAYIFLLKVCTNTRLYTYPLHIVGHVELITVVLIIQTGSYLYHQQWS